MGSLHGSSGVVARGTPGGSTCPPALTAGVPGPGTSPRPRLGAPRRLGRWAGTGLTVLVLLGAAPATATCVLLDCQESLTRPDGSPAPLDGSTGLLRLEAREPFVVRYRCDQSCAVAGGPGPASSPMEPRGPMLRRLGRGGLPCAGAPEAHVEGTDDPYAFRFPDGLPPGRYQVNGYWVAVGDAPELECPPEPPPPPVTWTPPAAAPEPAPERSWAEAWDDRDGVTWEAGVGGLATVSARRGTPGQTLVGGLALFGRATRRPVVRWRPTPCAGACRCCASA